MVSNNPEKDINIAQAEAVKYQTKILFTAFEIRILNLLAGLIMIYAIRSIFGITVSYKAEYVFYAWIATSACYLAFMGSRIRKTLRLLDNVHFSYYFFSIVYATSLVHYLGAAEWIAFFVYLFDLIYANVLMSRARAALITGLTVLAYFSLITLEYFGAFSHQAVFLPEEHVFNNIPFIISTHFIVIGVFFFLLSYSTGLFAKIKESREREVIESQNRFAVKTYQLEEITRRLSHQAAENKYLKRAAMGYIEKKEFELDKSRRDLEGQIDKLRKTQKSMYFMIEDLNEMSAQLKETRDNLEDKVRERTDELLNISRKLHRSERLAFLGKLAGSVTHELRNPLAVLKNASYFLTKKFKGKKDEGVSKYIGIIEKEIGIIDSIIDDIMGFAKTRIPEFEEADIGELVENSIATINIPKFINIKKEYQKLPQVEVDSNQVMHAVMNIANNAIIAMSGNGTLTFRTLLKDNYACIEIEDTGPGIPQDQRDLIFEPLFSSKPKGTGLGLPIAKMMIEIQGGRIEFDSKLGKGTIFYIILPVHRKKAS
ncbi:MAG: hypothetical protein HQ594_05295 [Candidatus Omnitrophica bacterium]|nr:hypothetical protein [Candidatus Omnitrophota bacterium]